MPSSSNLFKRRQTSLQLISPKLVNPDQKHLNAYTALQVRGTIFGLVVNCPFFFWVAEDCEPRDRQRIWELLLEPIRFWIISTKSAHRKVQIYINRNFKILIEVINKMSISR